MKKLLLAAALACGLVSAQAATNPLFAPLYTADPAVLVDAGRVYLFTGRDEAQPGGKDFVMHEWRVFSTCDMVTWKDEGVPIKARDFAWAKGRAWASDITKRNGKYYFYGTVEHATVPGFAIGVAVSDSPTGPFVDARGTALITNDMTKQTDIAWDDIDPAIPWHLNAFHPRYRLERVPRTLIRSTLASRAKRATLTSPAGLALATLPPTVPRLRICGPPTVRAAWASTRTSQLSSGRWGQAAPT